MTLSPGEVLRDYVGALLDGFAAFVFDVANGDKLNIGLLEEAAEVVRAPVPDADAAHHNALARRHRTVPTQHARGDNFGDSQYGSGFKGSAQKEASIELPFELLCRVRAHGKEVLTCKHAECKQQALCGIYDLRFTGGAMGGGWSNGVVGSCSEEV